MKQIITLTIFLTATFSPPAFPLIGGKAVLPGQFPSTVALPYLECSAVKISAKRFLTAAHCLANRGPFPIYKRDDTISILSLGKNGKLSQESSLVTSVRIHPSYMDKIAQTYDADLTVGAPGVIDLAVIDVTDKTSMPAATLNGSVLKKGDEVTIGGFGCESFDEDIQQRFQQNNVIYKIANKKVSSVHPQTVNVSLLNTDGLSQASGCGGDSGGPVYQNSDKGLSVVGINSFVANDEDGINFVKISSKEIIHWINSF